MPRLWCNRTACAMLFFLVNRVRTCASYPRQKGMAIALRQHMHTTLNKGEQLRYGRVSLPVAAGLKTSTSVAACAKK